MVLPLSKIVALNVRSGGGKRVDAICKFLERHEPDVVVLSEWREGASGQKFIGWAEGRGMVHARLNDGNTANGVFAAARTLFQSEKRTPWEKSPGALLLAHFQDWTLLASYFPQRDTKSRFFDVCAEVATAHANTPLAIIGDLNTGNQLFDKSPGAEPYACAARFDALTKEASLFDLWRHTNGTDAREWTWLSHKNNGFRIDHAFVNEPFFQLIQPSCVYDHSPRKEKLTDHSALIVTGIPRKPHGE